jgi:hypothetical protein
MDGFVQEREKMGFDLIIVQKLYFDKTTGLPFTYGKDGACVPYNPESFKIPQPFKSLVSQRGPHWHEYIKAYDGGWEYETSAEDFLANYPNWNMVFEGLEDDYSWTEQDHDMFRAALIWLSEKGSFYVNWSY